MSSISEFSPISRRRSPSPRMPPSGISQGDPFKTGVRAFTLAWAGMYVPFAFVFSPVLVFVPWILQKTPGPFPYMEFIFVLATVILGIIALGAIIIGFFGGATLKSYQRVIMAVALLCLWWHEPISSYVGAAMLAGMFLWQRSRRGKGETQGPKEIAPAVGSR